MRDTAIRNTHSTVVSINGDTDATDSQGNVVTLDETLITAEVTRLQDIYDSLAYARSRKQEYDKLNQWEMQFDDNRDGTTTWVDSINEIKVRFPK
jgi:hypothetical protein